MRLLSGTHRQDLDKRIAQHRQWIESQTKEGKPIPDNKKQEPSDLRPGPIGNHNYPGNCYAGMIAPIAGLSVKGAIFHQGYNNAFEGSVGAEMYRDIFPEMIRAWRKAFNDSEMPFGILSLCTDGYPQTRDNYCEKMFNAGIDIRAAQYQTFLDFYNAGDKNRSALSVPMTFVDAGITPNSSSPRANGLRVGHWRRSTALAGRSSGSRRCSSAWRNAMAHSCCDWIPMSAIPRTVRLKVSPSLARTADSILPTSPMPRTAKTTVVRCNTTASNLLLTSPMVTKPIHFRYAWGRNPLANLQATGNKDLPFATQRSDDWRMEEVPLGVLGDDVAVPISRGDRNKIIQALREQDEQRLVKEATQVIEAEAGTRHDPGTR